MRRKKSDTSAKRPGALRLIRETSSDPSPGKAKERVHCRSPGDAFRFMQPYTEHEEAETFWILALDVQSRVLWGSPIVITRGILNSSLVHPREVFRAAIVAGAAGIILVHNHPSGDPTPSADDRAVTRQLIQTGRLIDLPVYDHVIIGHSTYASFAEKGLV